MDGGLDPVILAEYDPRWVESYEKESEFLRQEFHSDVVLRLEHIGSTAVPGLAARRIVDILVEVSCLNVAEQQVVPIIEKRGYLRRRQADPPLGCLTFEKGCSHEACDTYRLHLSQQGHDFLGASLFRDHLRQYKGIAERYERLKRDLATQNPHDPAAYEYGKSEFIRKITERAVLGRRYPIEVVDYDSRWLQLYEEEAQFLRDTLGPELIVRTEHFGSTAVPGLAAKPVVDVLVEVTSFEAAERGIVPVLKGWGYFYSWQSRPAPGHMAFWKGYVPDVPQKYHLHMAPHGHPLMDRLLFRDYLRKYPATAREYEDLKYHLADLYRYDREEYTDAKAEFVMEVTERAKREFGASCG